MLKQMLSRMGYFSVVCNKPTDALTLFSRVPGRFDAIIMDEIMPGLRATQLAQDVSQIVVGAGVVRLEPQGLLVVRERLLRAAQ